MNAYIQYVNSNSIIALKHIAGFFSAEQLKTFASVINLMLLEKHNGYSTWYAWWLLYTTNRNSSHSHSLYLPSLGAQPCWRALATEMLGRWTLATPPQGCEHLREVLQKPKQSSAVLFKTAICLLSLVLLLALVLLLLPTSLTDKASN